MPHRALYRFIIISRQTKINKKHSVRHDSLWPGAKSFVNIYKIYGVPALSAKKILPVQGRILLHSR